MACACITVNVRGIDLYRIIDPEYRESFVSLSRLFASAGLTVLDGLARFRQVRSPAYEVTLSGLAPFDDIWLPLAKARPIAQALELQHALAGFLDPQSGRAYSVYDDEEQGLVHNWIVDAETLAPEQYSTEALLSAAFHRIVLLGEAPSIRTQYKPALLRLPSTNPNFLGKWDQAWISLTNWTLALYESNMDDQASDRAGATLGKSTKRLDFNGHGKLARPAVDLNAHLQFSLIGALLTASDTFPDDQISQDGLIVRLAPEDPALAIDKSEVDGKPQTLSLATLGALGHFALREWRASLRQTKVLPNMHLPSGAAREPSSPKPASPKPKSTSSPSVVAPPSPSSSIHLDAIQIRLQRLENRDEGQQLRLARAAETETLTLSLREEVARLEAVVAALRDAQKLMPPLPPARPEYRDASTSTAVVNSGAALQNLSTDIARASTDQNDNSTQIVSLAATSHLRRLTLNIAILLVSAVAYKLAVRHVTGSLDAQYQMILHNTFVVIGFFTLYLLSH
ncbi:uncharacterized protein L969DRAFT_87426 [Mixia osmundae IAM 14324]|uniref:Uncharacterized protein n=1 Tax=Mixia osmundae (strain CBS 9802 / IAM 14324 / JCM 22182 / KY 12970) TaxID=764103 RepID=G7E0S3_MIXOS|nr:uncharacterized protein L969DRAFT_87426 [Mixia osmundae IAM 14324]KEI39465.1 hypothetical protein L969DRAFT_87426 [Mixia osmundae IAM 14324]GAA96433.1 hypothetical protein E5Q_03100 [Mixia osmundae IAM 14324]